MNTIRAKFRCNSVENFGSYKQAKLTTVYSQTGENADFTKATPNGNMMIQIDSGVPAVDFFEPDKEYYLDFSKTTNTYNYLDCKNNPPSKYNVYIVYTNGGCYDMAMYDINGWSRGRYTGDIPNYYIQIPQINFCSTIQTHYKDK